MSRHRLRSSDQIPQPTPFARLLLCSSLLLLLAAATARAQELQCVVVATGSATLERQDRQPQANWQLELPPREVSLPWTRLRLPVMPIAGLMATADGALYTYGGGRMDHPLGARWILSPSFAAGLYHAGKGKRLGGVLEFRTGLEFSFRLVGRTQVGVVVYHLSNGNLYRNNPGTESVLFTYRTGLR